MFGPAGPPPPMLMVLTCRTACAKAVVADLLIPEQIQLVALRQLEREPQGGLQRAATAGHRRPALVGHAAPLVRLPLVLVVENPRHVVLAAAVVAEEVEPDPILLDRSA